MAHELAGAACRDGILMALKLLAKASDIGQPAERSDLPNLGRLCSDRRLETSVADAAQAISNVEALSAGESEDTRDALVCVVHTIVVMGSWTSRDEVVSSTCGLSGRDVSRDDFNPDRFLRHHCTVDLHG